MFSKVKPFLRSFYRKRSAAPVTPPKSIKCVIVGDSNIDKSSLRTSFLSGATSLASVVTAISCRHLTDVVVDDQPSTLTIWDTSGQEDYDYLRNMIYDETEVFFLCYNSHFPQTLRNVYERWLPEVQKKCPRAKYLLVETNVLNAEDEDCCDGVASSSYSDIVSPAEAENVARQMNASGHFECTYPTQERVSRVFEEATRVAMTERRKSGSPKTTKPRPRFS